MPSRPTATPGTSTASAREIASSPSRGPSGSSRPIRAVCRAAGPPYTAQATRWSRTASLVTPMNSCTTPAYERSMNSKGLRLAREKMQAAGVDPVAIDVFAHYYRQIEHGETGIIPESSIKPLDMESLADVEV